MAFNDEVRGDTILTYTRLWEILFDIAFMIHIALSFITAYRSEIFWITSFKLIAFNYLKTFFLFDIVSTLPGLINGQQSKYYAFKIIRYTHLKRLLTVLSQNLYKAFNRCGLSKQVV